MSKGEVVGDIREEVVILLRASIEETDEPEPAFAIMRLARAAGGEYQAAIKAIQGLVWSSTSVQQRALTDHHLTARQQDATALPSLFYLPDYEGDAFPAFWQAVADMKEDGDIAAIPLERSACPRDEHIAEFATAIPLSDDLTMEVHPLGIRWIGETEDPESEISIGDLPRHLVDDVVNGCVAWGDPYWERE